MVNHLAGDTSSILLGRLRRDPNDQEAWRQFVWRYGPKIHDWCRRWRLQKADAQDVTQNVLLKLALKLHTFEYDSGRSFRGWLYTLTRNALADFVHDRRQQERGSGDSQILKLLESLEARTDLLHYLQEEFDQEQLAEALVRVRLRVPPQWWQVFKLAALEGLPGAEVATRLQMKVATVFTTRSKVQKLVQQEIQKLERDSASQSSEKSEGE